MMTENVWGHAAAIVNYWPTSGKSVVQLAAKKTQSINSGYLANVLRSHRK
jgi:hypothetical protein